MGDPQNNDDGYSKILLPSGKHTKSYGKWPIEIDGLPFLNMVFFYSYVSLPEGKIW